MKNLKSIVLTFIGMLALIVCASMFTACTQDEYLPEIVSDTESPGVAAYEIVQLSTTAPSDTARILPPTRSTFAYNTWGSFNLLETNGATGHLDLNAGLYAVKITVASGSYITIKTTICNHAANRNSYTWRYIFDSDGDQIYFSGSENLPYGDNHNSQHTIYAGESLIVVLHARDDGEYYCYYRAI